MLVCLHRSIMYSVGEEQTKLAGNSSRTFESHSGLQLDAATSAKDKAFSALRAAGRCIRVVVLNMEGNWSPVALDVISAVDQNMGIGKGQELPWRIPSEFQYFLNMTSRTRSNSPHHRNAIIIGRKTWETMDSVTSKPFPGALNVVLSRFMPSEPLDYADTIVCGSLDAAVRRLSTEYCGFIEQVWVVGGAQVYRAALMSPYFRRLYLSRIHATYPCDIFFPDEFDEEFFDRVSDDKIGDVRVPRGVQTDSKDRVKFEVCVYEKKKEC